MRIIDKYTSLKSFLNSTFQTHHQKADRLTSLYTSFISRTNHMHAHYTLKYEMTTLPFFILRPEIVFQQHHFFCLRNFIYKL